MVHKFDRHVRVANLIREEIALLLSREVKDPKLQTVTITHVKVSRDLRRAQVFFSLMGTLKEREEAASSLKRAEGFIRRELGRSLHLKRIPALTFEYDDSYEKGMKIDALLKKLKEGGEDE
ncbi:MAG: 30S ribosome-binding factor RbfA [Deltaproteobacteria bacterium]|nr:MAG: 30S ribosome-binding factor RbfA [Deltaproteobacteria bacterium]